MAEDTKDQLVEVDYEKLKKRKQTRSRSPSFVEVYSNSMNMEVTFNDIKLLFGEIIVATQDELQVEEKVSVIMSPEHALACVKAMDKILKKYVTNFGPIREQPEG